MSRQQLGGGVSGARRGLTLKQLPLAVAAIWAFLAFLLAVFSTGPSRLPRLRETRCMSNLHELSQAYQLYLDTWDRYPSRLADLDQFVRSPSIFFCPKDKRVDARRGPTSYLLADTVGRQFVPLRRAKQVPLETVLASCWFHVEPGPPMHDNCFILRADGRTLKIRAGAVGVLAAPRHDGLLRRKLVFPNEEGWGAGTPLLGRPWHASWVGPRGWDQ